jgi:hypothetical protein
MLDEHPVVDPEIVGEPNVDGVTAGVRVVSTIARTWQ